MQQPNSVAVKEWINSMRDGGETTPARCMHRTMHFLGRPAYAFPAGAGRPRHCTVPSTKVQRRATYRPVQPSIGTHLSCGTMVPRHHRSTC